MMILNKGINQHVIIVLIKILNKQLNIKTMRNLTNGVDIQGMGNTIDLQTVINLYTSSFTEGFMKVLENYNTPLQEFVEVKNEVKPIKKPTSKPKSKNKGFEKLKNQLLREKLEKCNGVKFDSNTHIRVKDLRYKSIYELDKSSKKKWNEYFEWLGKTAIELQNTFNRY